MFKQDVENQTTHQWRFCRQASQIRTVKCVKEVKNIKRRLRLWLNIVYLSQYQCQNWGALVFSDVGKQRGGGETFLFCCDVMWCQHRRYIFRFPLMVQYNFTLTWLPIVQSNSSTNLIVLIVPPNNPRTTSNWLSKHHLYLNLHWGYPCSLNNTTLSNIHRHIFRIADNV